MSALFKRFLLFLSKNRLFCFCQFHFLKIDLNEVSLVRGLNYTIFLVVSDIFFIFLQKFCLTVLFRTFALFHFLSDLFTLGLIFASTIFLLIRNQAVAKTVVF